MRIDIALLNFTLIAWLAAPVEAQTRTAQPGDDLIGLWGSESTFGPEVRGDFTLERSANQWIARIAGFEVSAPAGADLRFVLPGGQGELRARVDGVGAKRSIRAFWVQPGGNVSPYAVPVTLERAGVSAWRGSIVPLDERFSLYLHVRRHDDGSLRGSFHNPEFNWNGRSRWFRVTRDGESVKLADPTTGRVRYAQAYDSGQRTIAMEFGTPIALKPRSADQAIGFYPRTPAATSYSYRAPVPQADGWRTAHVGDVGMDDGPLQALVQRILTSDPLGDSAPRIHSLLVARRGKLVLEEYFFGFNSERLHDLRSASKTITAIMAGVAVDRGARFTMQTPVYSLFPQSDSSASSDPRKVRITVAHLLTHSTGLACDDNDEASPGNEDTMQRQQKQRDWYRYTLDLSVVHDPGTRYAYCSGAINLVGGIIRQTTNTWLPEFFEQRLARPLQIERYAINLMPTGEAYSGGGIYMRPRDLLKLGELHLRGGVWNGARVVSKRWIDESTAHRIAVPNGSSDGYGWHRHTLRVGGRTYQEYEANGNGGQFLIVVPELDLAIVFTAGNYGQYHIWRKFRDELVPQYIIAAVKGR